MPSPKDIDLHGEPASGVAACSTGALSPARMAFTRGLLLAARDFEIVQDKIDCAEMALAIGRADIAQALCDLAFLRQGFGAQRYRPQAAIDQASGARKANNAPLASASVQRFSIDIAIEELIGLMLAPASSGLVLSPPSQDAPSVAPARTLSVDWTVAEAVALCADLRRALEDDDGIAALVTLLDTVHIAVLQGAPPDLAVGTSDPAALCAAFVRADLRHFFLTQAPLAYAPHGSAQLFHASARLDMGGLGPYLRNVALLIRDVGDVLGLVEVAFPAGATQSGRDRWIALLATHLDDHIAADLIDLLADHGTLGPVWSLVEIATLRAPLRRDRNTLWRARDAGLDNRVAALGVEAQRTLVAWDSHNSLEWSILGDILTDAGDLAAAEAAFVAGLQADPGNTGLLGKLRRLESAPGGILPLEGGFATPLLRKRTRLDQADRRLARERV